MSMLPHRVCCRTLLLLATFGAPALLTAQGAAASLDPAGWSATDSIRAVTYLGRPALWINRGVALLNGTTLTSGTIDVDVAASDTTNFVGLSFRAANPRFSDVVFLRAGASGTEEAVQYGPALNSLGVAWQVYHDEHAHAIAAVPRNQWIHLRLAIDGESARLYVDTATVPTLEIPRLTRTGGLGVGFWTGAFGRGAYYSRLTITPTTPSAPTRATPPSPAGTITRWELSPSIEAAEFRPAALPDLGRMKWDPAEVEPEGWLLINRYREAPIGGTPTDSTGAVLVDSVMTGKMARARVVYARTTIVSPHAQLRRLQFSYNNGVVIYLNGQPLFLGMNPSGLRAPLGIMNHAGDAVYLPLRAGTNTLVFAVIAATGGWACGARLDP